MSAGGDVTMILLPPAERERLAALEVAPTRWGVAVAWDGECELNPRGSPGHGRQQKLQHHGGPARCRQACLAFSQPICQHAASPWNRLQAARVASFLFPASLRPQLHDVAVLQYVVAANGLAIENLLAPHTG